MYKVSFTPTSERQMKRIFRDRYKVAISEIINDLKENPYDGKRLERDLLGKYMYRIGVFRIVYKVLEREKSVIILFAGHRSTVYQ